MSFIDGANSFLLSNWHYFWYNIYTNEEVMMISKIVKIALIVAVAILIYNKFLKDTIEPFFKGKADKVDLLQLKSTIDDVEIDY